MTGPGAASRATLAAGIDALDGIIDRARPEQLGPLADQLFAVTELLVREAGLRRALADPSADPDRRQALFDRLLGNQLDGQALELLRPLVRERWSSPRDLAGAVETLSRRAVLGIAERAGALDDVEDQLFRFGRILDGESRLALALEDPLAPTDRKVALLDRLIGDRVDRTTHQLLEHAVRASRGHGLEQAVTALVELAAARRERYVAYVTAPAPLTEQQESRLAGSLSRVYGRQISLQVTVDPALLGGLVVRVNDEVIDGSVVSRLAAIRKRMTG